MTVISRISKTRKGRFALFSQEGFLFSVDEQTFGRLDLHEGSSLTDEELSSIKEQSDAEKAKERALSLLGRRAHGRMELAQKLERYYDDDSIIQALDALENTGLLDDAAFARERAEFLKEKGHGRVDIRYKLQAVGIDRSIAQEAVSALEIDDGQQVRDLIEKRYLLALAQGQREKVIRALSRRGFAFEDIFPALEKYEHQTHESESDFE